MFIMNTTTVFSKGWIDIVFDGRNQAYGAYELRRINDRTLIFAMLFSTAIAVGAAMLSLNNRYQPQPPGERTLPPTVLDTMVRLPFLFKEKEEPKPKSNNEVKQKNNTRDEFSFEIVDSIEIVEEPDTSLTVTEPALTASIEGAVGEGISSIEGTGVDGGGEESGGSGTPGVDGPESNTPKDWAEVMPEFPGGYPALKKFISRNVDYPGFARENGIEGIVYLGFIVEKDGSMSHVSILRGVHRSLDEESIRVVKLMPRWKPGSQNGNPVRVRYKLPISYSLQ